MMKFLKNKKEVVKGLSTNIQRPPSIFTQLGKDSSFYYAAIVDTFNASAIGDRNIIIQGFNPNQQDTIMHNVIRNTYPYTLSSVDEKINLGYFLPDIVSDSILFIQNYSQAISGNNRTLNLFKIAKNGKIVKSNLKLIGNKYTLNDTYNQLKYQDFIVFPNYDSNYYWVLVRPYEVPSFGKGDYMQLFKLYNKNGQLNFGFVKNIYTVDSSIQSYRKFRSMFVAPQGNKFVIMYDTFAEVYDVQNRFGEFELRHRYSLNLDYQLLFNNSIEFNFEGNLVYGIKNSDYHLFEIYQVNLNDGSFQLQPKIIERGFNNRFMDLKLGPDKLIYINSAYQGKLGVISNPNQIELNDYSNEVGYLNYGVDLNTIQTLTSRDVEHNSNVGLPTELFQNITDSIQFKFKLIACDSIYLSSNFPSRIFHKWVVNLDTVNSLNPIAKIKLLDSNVIQLIVGNVKIQSVVYFKDSIKNNRLEFDLSNPKQSEFILDSAFSSKKLYFKTNPIFKTTDSVFWVNNFGEKFNYSIYSEMAFSKPGVYTAMAKNACFQIPIGPITINLPCSDSKYNYLFLNKVGLWKSLIGKDTGIVVLDGNNIVDANDILTLRNCIVLFRNNSQLNILKQGKLIAQNVYFISCGTWKGITVFGNNLNGNNRDTSGLVHGSVYLDNCKFLNAEVALTSVDGGYLFVKNSKFTNNFHHIDILNYPFFHFSQVNNNTFNFTKQNDSIVKLLNKFQVDGSNVNYQMRIQGVKNQVINGNFFNNPLYNNCEKSNLKSLSLVLKATDTISLLSNKYESINSNIMIYDSLSHSNKYLINDFVCKNSYNTDSFLWNKNTTGILLRNTDSTFIDRNLFYKGYSGIQYYQINSSNHISNVERNKFVNCDYGFISATKTNPLFSNSINSSTNIVKLKLKCNTFNTCGFGWLGTGQYFNQGVSALSTGNSFGNIFFNNILLISPFSKYYWFNIDEKPNLTNLFSVELDNASYSNSNVLSSNVEALPSLSFLNCLGKRNLNAGFVDLVDDKIIVVPNPFTNQLKIYSQIKEIKFLQLIDINGKIIATGSGQLINLDEISSGFYILKIFTNSGIESIKVMKE